MATYDTAIAALTDTTAGQTLAEANHADRHNESVDADQALAAHLDAAEAAAPLARLPVVIVETAAGVWSGDAPPDRTGGANPCWFIPLDPDSPTDPADATNGIDTPANLRSWDLLGPVTVGSL